MTRHDDMVYVALMRDEIRGAIEAVDSKTQEEFAADELAVGAACYHIVRLAERPLKASAAFRGAHPEIPWEDLAAVRGRTEPEFPKEDPQVVWQIVTREFPPILVALESLLPTEPLWGYRAEEDGVGAEPREDQALPLERLQVKIPLSVFAELCNRYDVRRIRVFGSVLRDDFGPDSDIDMLVDFGPNAPHGWDIFHFDDEMSSLLGHKADVMHGKVIRYIREQVMAEARTIYMASKPASAKGLPEGRGQVHVMPHYEGEG